MRGGLFLCICTKSNNRNYQYAYRKYHDQHFIICHTAPPFTTIIVVDLWRITAYPFKVMPQ